MAGVAGVDAGKQARFAGEAAKRLKREAAPGSPTVGGHLVLAVKELIEVRVILVAALQGNAFKGIGGHLH